MQNIFSLAVFEKPVTQTREQIKNIIQEKLRKGAV